VIVVEIFWAPGAVHKARVLIHAVEQVCMLGEDFLNLLLGIAGGTLVLEGHLNLSFKVVAGTATNSSFAVPLFTGLAVESLGQRPLGWRLDTGPREGQIEISACSTRH
jgi:hypothetical protein